MSVEYWINAEQFYEFWFVIISLLFLINIIVIIFVIVYAKKENRKKFIFLTVGSAAIFGMVGVIGYVYYHPYLEQASYTNPLIRDREPRMLTYTYYGTVEETNYYKLNYLDGLRQMTLYEEEQIVEPIHYLGKGKYFHYFERENGEFFKQNLQVEFTETAQQAQLIGGRFTLKDEAFQKIGFKNPESTMFEGIEIPVAEQGKTYEPEDEAQIPRAEDSIRFWNF